MSDLLERASLHLAWNEPEKAQACLDAHNSIQRTFGFPEAAMPRPMRYFEGLITAPAESMSPNDFMRSVCSGEAERKATERDLRFTMELQRRRA